MKLLICLISFFFISIASAFATNRCEDYLIMDGAETIVKYGMDTTQHWWIITQPFTNIMKITIDGEPSEDFSEILDPVFSADGERWACFVRDYQSWLILTNDTIIDLNCNLPGELVYSGDSKVLAYSCISGSVESVHIGKKIFSVSNRIGKLYVSYEGSRYSIMGQRGDKKVINLNGTESTSHDDIIPIGFWHTGEMLYITKDGNNAEVMKNNTPISEKYYNIDSPVINILGTASGVAVQYNSGKMSAVLFSDEYTEPLIGRQYDAVSFLSLHPLLPMLAYNAVDNLQNVVVLNTTEYFGGKYGSAPMFSYDGTELYFIGCDIDCFISINGKKFSIMQSMDVRGNYAYSPIKKAIAYSTSASMIVRDIEKNTLHAGMMVDEIIQPRYNRRAKRFETIGRISQRMYLMTCAF